MDRVQIRDAKAKFSALVEAAESGRPTTIARHGRPATVVVSVDDARKLYGYVEKSLAELVLLFPGGVDPERDASPPRAFEF